jgi:2-(1,2-epoxy-1,2-dihydrophenyl)acetyl-CoA isomerase
MAREMDAAFAELLGGDPAAIVVTGGDGAFCAGGDLPYIDRCLTEDRVDDAMELVRIGGKIVRGIHACAKPVIAAVNGPAMGGGASLAIACDLRFGSERSRFGFVYTRLGLFPAWGASFFLPRIVGEERALELIWEGASIYADRAARLGILDRLVPAGELGAQAVRFARELADRPREGVGELKTLFRSGARAELGARLRREEETLERLFRSADVRRRITEAAHARGRSRR